MKIRYKCKNINHTTRRAFTMAELTLSLALIGTMTIGFMKLVKNYTEDQGHAMERAFNQGMNSGIQASFIDIIEAFQRPLSNFRDNSVNWGWTLAKNTSPLPISGKTNGIGYIDYEIDTGLLSAAELTTLQGKIISNFNGICSPVGGQPRGNVRLTCPQLNRITYTLGAVGGLVRGHTPNTPLNSSLVPTVRVDFWREFPTSTRAKVSTPYTFNLTEVYNARRNYSTRKINTIRNAMESFHNRQVMREVANSVSSGGLNSMDDEFVPWFWQMFGDNSIASPNTTICAKGAGTTCANLNTNNIWRSNLSQRGLFMNRIINNLLAGDRSFGVDGFNNPIFIYPIMSQCPVATRDLMLCPVAAPALPADNYMAIGNPPYLSAIYTPSFSDRSAIAPDYGRVYVSY